MPARSATPRDRAVRIRVMRGPDATLLSDVVNRFRGGGQARVRPPRAFLRDRRLVAVVATEDERPVGWAWGVLLPHPERPRPMCLLYSVDVDRHRRRGGIGRALVEALATEASRRGAERMWLLSNSSNSAAMALYRSVGMTRPHRDDVLFRRSLPGRR